MQVRHKRHQHMMRRADGGRTPALVSGNPKVVEAAKSTKSIGKVSGIYSKARLDRKSRG